MVLGDPALVGTVGLSKEYFIILYHPHKNCCTGPKSSTLDHPSQKEGNWKFCSMRGRDRILLMQIIYHFSSSGFTYKFYVFSFPLSAYHCPISPAAMLLFFLIFVILFYLLLIFTYFVCIIIYYFFNYPWYFFLTFFSVSLMALLFTPVRNSLLWSTLTLYSLVFSSLWL